jgi:hypothetical protein
MSGSGFSQSPRKAQKPGKKQAKASGAKQTRSTKQKSQPERFQNHSADESDPFGLSPEQNALAWEIGVYNPLQGMEDEHGRSLTDVEEDWLFKAKEVGWLDVEDSLDAIYFTAPPPKFSLKQADWYLRPNLLFDLEEPKLLRKVVQQYPIPPELITTAVTNHVERLGWSSEKFEIFVQELFDKPASELNADEQFIVLLELTHPPG